MEIKEIRLAFIETMGGRVFTKEEVMQFLEPHFAKIIEPDKIIEREKSLWVSRFIQSIRDGEGLREAIAFNSSVTEEENEQIAYAFITNTSDLDILNRQLGRIQTQIDGLLRTKTKIEAKIKEAKDQLELTVGKNGEFVLTPFASVK